MAVQDQYGNYEPDMHDPMIGQTPSSKHGHGSPEGIISACTGETYIDDDTGDFYYKTGGCNSTGWTLVTAGGGGGDPAQEYTAAAGTNPTGLVIPRGTTDIAINTTDGSIYWYFSGAWTS